MWAIPRFQREVLKARKRSIYICLCVRCSTVVFHTINACIAIKCYNSPRNYAIQVVDFILSALQLSNTVDKIFHCSVKDTLHFQQVHLGWIFCFICQHFFSPILSREHQTLHNSLTLCTFVVLMARPLPQTPCVSCKHHLFFRLDLFLKISDHWP